MILTRRVPAQTGGRSGGQLRRGLLLVCLLGAAPACAGSSAGDRETTTLRRQVDVMRTRGVEDGRTIRRLEDRVFLLEDQLETARLQRAGSPDPLAAEPPAPVLRAEPPPAPVGLVVDVVEGGLAPEPGVQVVYEGEALNPGSKRIVLGDDSAGSSRSLEVADAAPRRRRSGAPPVARPVPSRPEVAAIGHPDRLDIVPVARAAARPAPAVGTVASSDAGPERAYRAAVDALKGHEHVAAIAGLRSFLKRWPTHDFADNAQYWLGEAYYDQRDFKTALSEFQRVLDDHPRGNKAPDALFKLALTHLGLGDASAARTVLSKVVATYPTSNAARLAEQRLGELPQ